MTQTASSPVVEEGFATAVEATVVRDSFYEFVQTFWPVIIPEEPVWNWHIRYLCDELQAVAKRVIARKPKKYDLIINVPPGSTKSTLASVMYPIWLWTQDPTLRTLCGSYAFPLSLYLASLSRIIMLSDKFKELFPDLGLVKEGEGFLINNKRGSRFATTVAGSVTGMHGHIQIIDDPLNPREAMSDASLRAANNWMDHTLPSRVIDKQITPLILIMQRLHEADPTGHLLDTRGHDRFKHICLPAEVSKDVRPRSLRRRYVKGLFDPIRLPRKVLDEFEAELGAYAYAGQYGQTPVPYGLAMFDTTKIEVRPFSGKAVKAVRYWDKAGSKPGRNAQAYTVGTLLGQDHVGQFVVLDVVRGQWEAAGRERVIKQTAEQDGKGITIIVEQEPGSGGKESAQATVRNLAGWVVIKDRPTGDKVTRADPLAVQVNNGNVWLAEGEWNRAYLHEFQFFPFSKTKDQVDSTSGAFAHITKIRRKIGAFR